MRTIRSAAGRIVETRLQQDIDVPINAFQASPKDFLSLVKGLGDKSSTDVKGSPGSLEVTDAMVDQVLAFVGAGHETIAGAVSWVRHLCIVDDIVGVTHPFDLRRFGY